MLDNNFPKISVLLITYNQESTIGRSLDSALIQKGFIYEIIIADDYSTDNTWKVIIEYKNRYPDIIKPYRNKRNLGIMGNLESTWDKPKGDLMMYLAGDDAISNDLFKTVLKFIQLNNIDYTSGAFCIFTDTKIIRPDGRETIFSNKLISKGYDAKSLKIRNKIVSARGIFLSKDLLARFKPIDKNVGIHTDGLFDMQIHLRTDKNYYIPFTGGIYYEGIGVSVKTSKDESQKSLKLLYEEMLKNISFSRSDRDFVSFKINHLLFQGSPTLKRFFLIFYFYLISLKPHYGMNIKSDIMFFVRLGNKLLKS
jgi:glycosyltransferase involved in cell wall biosynthesis